MRVIGLTGGIASGKSSVAKLLERQGASVVDADLLAREIVAPGSETLRAIARLFGGELINVDGSLNRGMLAEIIFSNDRARRDLEGVTHPAIRALAAEKLKTLEEAGKRTAFYVAPLLIEAGSTVPVDEIWVVYLDPETQLARLMARDNLTREGAMKRIASQMPMEEKKRRGKVVIDNRGSLEELEAEVRRVWQEEVA